MTTKHAVYPPSSLHRILACPASAHESTRAPVQAPSSYAERGSYLHTITETAFTKFRIEEYLKTVTDLEHEERNWVLDCYDYFHSVLKFCSNDIEIKSEVRVDLDSWGLPEIWGTSDKSIYDISNKHVHVIDWKFGSGVQVFAQNNPQLLAYAAGVVGFPALNIDEITIHVVQPPLNHFDDWTISYDDLRDWVFGTLELGIKAAQSPRPQYNPGENQCRFCPASMTCSARHNKQLANAADVFQAYSDLPLVKPEQIADVLSRASELEKYIREVRLYAQAELMHGRSIPGWKLVSGRSIRKWADEEAAIGYIEGHTSIPEEKMYVAKFISPAQAEKLDRSLKGDPTFEALVTKPEGKPQLATADDKRPAIDPTSEATEVFKNVS